MTFKGGELSAEEHLVIQGVVSGTVELKNHNLTIGESGRIKANLKAKRITIEGMLEGDMRGDETVVIKRTATVVGNVTAPRVSVEEGASVQGSIQTKEEEEAASGKKTPQVRSLADTRDKEVTDRNEAQDVLPK